MTAPLDETLRQARILIVDDEAANVELLELLLARAGYTALSSTTDARRVLPLFQQDAPDLVLLDLLMPRLDGFAVLEQLRAVVPSEDYRPVLVLTADITPGAKQRALAAGAKDFLTKPFDQIELLLRVRNLLETRLVYLRLQQQHRALEQLFAQERETVQHRDRAQASLSHDLGQPASALRIAAQLLRRDVAGERAIDRVAVLAHAQMVDSTASQVLAITGELLDLARLQAGKPLDLHPRKLDLVALVVNEVTTQQAMTERHHIQVESSAAQIHGEWDPLRLRRVLTNLLSNAVKYSPAGGEIRVTVSRQPAGACDWVEIVVQDAGVGIPAADLSRLFTPFYRATNVADRIAGTGLGLTGARQIVQQHGGTLTVTSAEGAGTTVTVRLRVE
jgi:signal transduction histidine kinase